MKLFFSSLLLCASIFAQNITYDQILAQKGLVQIQKLSPAIAVNLKYSTADNFMHEDLYGDFNTAYLRSEVAAKLAAAEENLQKTDPSCTLLEYDAFRPRSVQRKMWNKVKGTDAQKYVANPEGGSIHNFGCAVDLTIAKIRGSEILPLDMGTPYDFFGELAQPRYEDKFIKAGMLSQEQIKNRKLLRKIMSEAGFTNISNEWWHFEAYNRQEIKRRGIALIE